MKQLLLVRHAESENNVIYDRVAREHGHSGPAMEAAGDQLRRADPTLSETGFAQAELLGEALADQLAGRRTVLVSSPMLRALITADAVRRHMDLPRDRFFCARDLYEVGGCYYGPHAEPGMGRAEIEARFPVDASDVPEAGWFTTHGGRETSEHAWPRIERALLWIERFLAEDSPGFDTLVVVAHGDLLTRLLRMRLNMPWRQPVTFVHGNTGITELMWNPNGHLLLRGLNDLSHLPHDLRTGQSTGWFYYTQPEVEINRFLGRATMPDALLSASDQLRRVLLAAEGKELAHYQESDQRAVHFVARVRAQPAGYVQYDPHTNRLRQMIVHEDFRDGGIGRRLVRAVREEAGHHGREELMVHAWERSGSFYQRLGFEVRGAVRTESQTPWMPMFLSAV